MIITYHTLNSEKNKYEDCSTCNNPSALLNENSKHLISQ